MGLVRFLVQVAEGLAVRLGAQLVARMAVGLAAEGLAEVQAGQPGGS